MIAVLGMLAFVAASCAEDSRTVSIYEPSYREQTRELKVGVNSCHADLEADVVETAAEVTVTVTATGGSSFEDCSDVLTLQLDQPLDGRQVVDGVSGQALEVTLDPQRGRDWSSARPPAALPPRAPGRFASGASRAP